MIAKLKYIKFILSFIRKNPKHITINILYFGTRVNTRKKYNDSIPYL